MSQPALVSFRFALLPLTSLFPLKMNSASRDPGLGSYPNLGPFSFNMPNALLSADSGSPFRAPAPPGFAIPGSTGQFPFNQFRGTPIGTPRQSPATSATQPPVSFKDILAKDLITEETANWLVAEGVDSMTILRNISAAQLDVLLAKNTDLPFGQTIMLRSLRDRVGPGEKQTQQFMDPAIQQIFAPLPATPPQIPRAPEPGDFSNPAVILGLDGKQADYHDICDNVIGYTVEKERIPLAGSDGSLFYEAGPRRPKLHSITISQWGAANARIMQRLIGEKALDLHGVACYNAYTAKIFGFAPRYVWETILIFDREYRKLQANYKFEWGRDVSSLSATHLIPLPASATAKKSTKSSNRKTDPKSGKEICLNFNRGACSATACRYAHVCTSCNGDHPATTHSDPNA